MSKYSYFTTSDGRLWMVENKPKVPDWTKEQIARARASIVQGVVFLQILIILLALFIVYRLFGR